MQETRLGWGDCSQSPVGGSVNRPYHQLQQRPAQNEQRDVEIDNQAGHIDQRGDKGRGRGRGVEAETAQQKRKHRSADRSPRNDTDERDSDRDRDEPVIFPIIENVEILPKTDSEKADRSQN